jgi:ABC-type nitrate/sulfonate/bicarbonate transport system substrate-binding protein
MPTTLNYTRCPGVPTISAIAHRLGLIAEEFAGDADIKLIETSVGFSPKLDYAHDERFWIRNAGHAPAVWKKAKGVDAKVVGLAFLEGSYPVVALRQAGIRSVAGLKGRRLALISRNDGQFDLMENQQLKIYQTTLATAGLTLADVELVRLTQRSPAPGTAKADFFLNAFRERIALLEEGRVDAFASAAIPPDAGDFPPLDILYDTRLNPDFRERVNPSVLRGVVVSGPLLAERRDLVVRILARLIEAQEWATANPLAALRLVATDLDVPPERLAASYESIAQGVQLDLGPDRLEALRVQKDFLLRHGLIEQDIDLEDFVDSTPLDEARGLLARRKRQPEPEPALAG